MTTQKSFLDAKATYLSAMRDRKEAGEIRLEEPYLMVNQVLDAFREAMRYLGTIQETCPKFHMVIELDGEVIFEKEDTTGSKRIQVGDRIEKYATVEDLKSNFFGIKLGNALERASRKHMLKEEQEQFLELVKEYCEIIPVCPGSYIFKLR